ncbi:hypothetical protein HPB47_016234 [Ixodes persulcatus]|uniref:Uncharacterized protein n=1 Tax=Ixodes persulcatus TaxID=34615 RepID=A0AC60QTT8_IXOPE|nr:hypothetical protein HPB47_016234 [Ixodes persulcatus]
MSTKLVTAIKREFLSNIRSTTHLNNASKAAIQVLISTMTFKIMGASWIYNKNLDMQIDDPALYKTNSALHSYVSVHEMAFMTKIARGSSNRWPLSAFSTDCWYESGSRTIYVPMLIFSVSLRGSNTSQIAQAGIRIGRCIFYMLLYVANSRNISGQWLSDEARHTTAATGRCFSELTQAQLMAALRDGLATRVAYHHFQKVVGGRGKPIRLRLATDEIVMGAEQLFFVYLVLQLCEARIGPYSLASATEVLWNAVLRHEPGFSNAFGCRPGTSMHPPQWCGPAQLDSLYYAQLSPRVV